jgi:predicted N-acetyltransferase YhbS
MSAHLSVRPVTPDDIPEISALHARVFGPGRFVRSAYRVRDGLPPFSRFCLVSYLDGKLVAAIRFAEVTIGGRAGALLLGPLAVESGLAGQGYGTRLIAQGLENAKAAGMQLVVLVGDEPYYGRFGFRVVPPSWIALPGPVDPARILAAELTPGAIERFQGIVAAARGGSRG